MGKSKNLNNVILLRDHSDNSRKAEAELDKYKIKHAQLFCQDLPFGKPELLTPDVCYRGLNNIEWFVSQQFFSQYKMKRTG